MNEEFRQRAAEAMYTKGLSGLTAKLTIKKVEDGKEIDHDLYLHLGYFEGRLNYIDITCDGRFDYTVRRLITMICDHVRRELRHGILTEEDLIRDWRGTFGGTNSFEPQGTCDQFQGGYFDKLVASPLDAVARWMKRREEKP